MRVILNNYPWFTKEDIHVCGYCFVNGQLLREESLAGYLSALRHPALREKTLLAANGLFAVVIAGEDYIIAATDRTRTYPLFYSQDGLLSDDHTRIPNAGKWDESALAFYHASGAVQPGHTLIQSVRQLPPAGWAIYEAHQWAIHTYASFLCTPAEERYVSIAELDATMQSVFSRLIDSVNGRQLLIPLTAGNDSRLILCMLKRLNYSNVLCYTVTGDKDSEWIGAHEAAQQLGYKHVKIDMQDPAVRNICYADRNDLEAYCRYAGAYTNFCWLYDYVAIRYMEAKQLIKPEAVFVPGHSGDMFGGSHLTKGKVSARTSPRGMARRMIYVGFEYQPNDIVKKEVNSYFEKSLQEGFTSHSSYQNQVVQHRQLHNILQSIRVYLYCGYEVRLPLWDNDLYDLFSHLPYEALHHSRLYTDYVRYVFENYSLSVNEAALTVSWVGAAIRKIFKYHLSHRLLPLFRHTADPLGEGALSKPMGEELTRWLGYPHPYTNTNEIMLRWYEMRVSQGRG